MGLIILRIAASGLLVAVAWNNLSHGASSILSVSVIFPAIFLALGLFTTAASSLAAVLTMTLSLLFHQVPLVATIVTVLVCIALALLGAGAYSIDARLFGQRRVVWPNH